MNRAVRIFATICTLAVLALVGVDLLRYAYGQTGLSTYTIANNIYLPSFHAVLADVKTAGSTPITGTSGIFADSSSFNNCVSVGNASEVDVNFGGSGGTTSHFLNFYNSTGAGICYAKTSFGVTPANGIKLFPYQRFSTEFQTTQVSFICASGVTSTLCVQTTGCPIP